MGPDTKRKTYQQNPLHPEVETCSRDTRKPSRWKTERSWTATSWTKPTSSIPAIPAPSRTEHTPTARWAAANLRPCDSFSTLILRTFAPLSRLITITSQHISGPPAARAADLLEIYAPLFLTRLGKEQVLLPHCVSASRANDVNLFINGGKDYVAPVTSRVRFLARRGRATEPVMLRLRVPDGTDFKWALAYSAAGAPYRVTLTHSGEVVNVGLACHGSASMAVAGKRNKPALADADAARLAQFRDRLFPPPETLVSSTAARPMLPDPKRVLLRLEGTQVGDWGSVAVKVDGKKVGEVSSAFGVFPLGSGPPPRAPRWP